MRVFFGKISENHKKNLRGILKTVEKMIRKFYTNLSKFIKSVFDIYLNFIKLSNSFKIFRKTNKKFEQVFCKI